MTTRKEPPTGKAMRGIDFPTADSAWTIPAHHVVDRDAVPVDEDECSGPAPEEPPAWVCLSTDEALRIFLALEEYASGFSLSLSADELEQTRGLAKRVAKSAALHIDE